MISTLSSLQPLPCSQIHDFLIPIIMYIDIHKYINATCFGLFRATYKHMVSGLTT